MTHRVRPASVHIACFVQVFSKSSVETMGYRLSNSEIQIAFVNDHDRRFPLRHGTIALIPMFDAIHHGLRSFLHCVENFVARFPTGPTLSRTPRLVALAPTVRFGLPSGIMLGLHDFPTDSAAHTIAMADLGSIVNAH